MPTLAEIIELLNRIPAPFWVVAGVMVTGAFTIAAQILTNRSNDQRLGKQFKYERNLRNYDSDLALRKGVYLEAVEAIYSGLQAIGKLIDLGIPNDEIGREFARKAPAMGKVHVIGDESVLNAMVELSDKISDTFIRLNVKRLVVANMQQSVTLVQEQLQKSESEQNRWLELVKQFNLEGSKDKRLWDTINHNFQHETERIKELLVESQNSTKVFTEGQMELIEEGGQALIEISPLIWPAVSAIRAHLNLPLAAGVYERITERTHERQKAMLDDFMGQIRASVAEQNAISNEAVEEVTNT